MKRPSNCRTRDVVVTRPWSMELRWKRSLFRNGLKLNFHRYIGQLWRPLVFRRWLGVVLSFTGVVCVRTTATCTPNATVRPSRWTAVVDRTGRRRTELFVRNKENLTDHTMNLSMTFVKMIELSITQKTNKGLQNWKQTGSECGTKSFMINVTSSVNWPVPNCERSHRPSLVNHHYSISSYPGTPFQHAQVHL